MDLDSRESWMSAAAPTGERLRPPTKDGIGDQLERRFGRLYSRQRLGIEDDHEARAAGSLRPSRWYLSAPVIRGILKLTGLYWRARKNTERIQIRQHDIVLPGLPAAFAGFTILQISDLHVDMNQGAMQRLSELLPRLSYDLCVLTGDYRGKTFGPFAAALEGMARLCAHIVGPVYGVLGNHDSIRMVPALEKNGDTHAGQRSGRAAAIRQKGCILPASTTPISTGSTISKKQSRRSLPASARSCCPIPRRSTARPRTPISICC